MTTSTSSVNSGTAAPRRYADEHSLTAFTRVLLTPVYIWRTAETGGPVIQREEETMMTQLQWLLDPDARPSLGAGN
jgi:hypothetical protein